MIVFRALQGLLGGSMIPTVFTTAFIYFHGQQRVIAAATVGAHRLARADARARRRRLDHRQLLLALAVLRQPRARHLRRRRRAAAGARSTSRTCRCCAAPTISASSLMAVFLGCLEYALEEGPRWNWFGDDTIRTTAWIAGIAGVAFVLRSLTYRAAGRRSARAEEPQFRARLLPLLRHRHRHLRDDLPDAAVPRPGARLQRAADRLRRLLDRRVPGLRHPDLHLPGASASICAG